MECGEQCVTLVIPGMALLPVLCAGNWGTMSTQVEVS